MARRLEQDHGRIDGSTTGLLPTEGSPPWPTWSSQPLDGRKGDRDTDVYRTRVPPRSCPVHCEAILDLDWSHGLTALARLPESVRVLKRLSVCTKKPMGKVL